MIELSVKGMTCGHCVSAVTRAVKAVDPQASVQVDLEDRRVQIEGRRSADEVIQALEEAGYPAELAPTQSPAGAATKRCCCT